MIDLVWRPTLRVVSVLAWALIAAGCASRSPSAPLVVPEIRPGLAFGQSRVVCGVHGQSDVTAGRIVGASVLARLHADPVFRAQLDSAKKEVADATAQALEPTRDCAAEMAALAVR